MAKTTESYSIVKQNNLTYIHVREVDDIDGSYHRYIVGFQDDFDSYPADIREIIDTVFTAEVMDECLAEQQKWEQFEAMTPEEKLAYLQAQQNG